LLIPFDLRLETKKAFYLVYREGRELSYGMKAFHDWIIAGMASEKGEAGNPKDRNFNPSNQPKS
jgi:LysR family glycine cleavage system transcriptional activator